MNNPVSSVMIGATGAVGGEVVKTLSGLPQLGQLTLLGRRVQDGLNNPAIRQHVVDVMDPSSYTARLAGHQVAICTLGVGQPSKVSREEFVRTDKIAVLDFAKACKAAGIRHFELLCSVGADSNSRSFYLQQKGKFEDGLRALAFERLSLFQPSVILTPTNRYGLLQWFTLAGTRLVSPLLLGGGLSKFKGIPVELLGAAIARNIATDGHGVERLHYNRIMELSRQA